MDFIDLSKYDDLFTDVFLDDLNLWFKTSKLNAEHRRPRIPSHKVLDIIQRTILDERNPSNAIAEFLKMDYFKHYIASKSVKQRQEFVQHMKRYLYMYMPNAGFEISDTRRHRQEGRRVDACLVATKNWHVGDELRFCTAAITHLMPKEDQKLRKSKRNFNIMYSTRKEGGFLFLGPVRFVNHDCDSNCKFILSGQNTVTFKAVKEIKCGEELTAYYGNHFNGENNCVCRCKTCELFGDGYFSSSAEDSGDGRSRGSQKPKPAALNDDYVTDLFIPDGAKSEEGEEHHHHQSLVEKRRKSSSVMSIDFLCGRQTEERTIPTSPLHLLCDAVLEHEYIKVDSSHPKALTVLVGQKDANNAVSISMYYPGPSPVSENGNTKADSAVSMSPQQQWTPPDEGLDGILDDSSDLSSIASTELAGLSDLDEDEREDEEQQQQQQQQHQQDRDEIKKKQSTEKSDQLTCIACHRELRREEISKEVGCDTTITADLVTWTWTPSAIFTDWRPKRCPRCERHYSIFGQEWPSRKSGKRKSTSQQQKHVIPAATSSAAAAGPKSKSKKVPSSKRSKRKFNSPSQLSPHARKKHQGNAQSNNSKNIEETFDDLYLYESPLTPLSEFYGDEDELLVL